MSPNDRPYLIARTALYNSMSRAYRIENALQAQKIREACEKTFSALGIPAELRESMYPAELSFSQFTELACQRLDQPSGVAAYKRAPIGPQRLQLSLLSRLKADEGNSGNLLRLVGCDPESSLITFVSASQVTEEMADPQLPDPAIQRVNPAISRVETEAYSISLHICPPPPTDRIVRERDPLEEVMDLVRPSETTIDLRYIGSISTQSLQDLVGYPMMDVQGSHRKNRMTIVFKWNVQSFYNTHDKRPRSFPLITNRNFTFVFDAQKTIPPDLPIRGFSNSPDTDVPLRPLSEDAISLRHYTLGCDTVFVGLDDTARQRLEKWIADPAGARGRYQHIAYDEWAKVDGAETVGLRRVIEDEGVI